MASPCFNILQQDTVAANDDGSGGVGSGTGSGDSTFTVVVTRTAHGLDKYGASEKKAVTPSARRRALATTTTEEVEHTTSIPVRYEQGAGGKPLLPLVDTHVYFARPLTSTTFTLHHLVRHAKEGTHPIALSGGDAASNAFLVGTGIPIAQVGILLPLSV